MSHLSFQEPGPEVALEVDWVVVGSGPGGATAAVTLARAGLKVALVEAGAWRDPEHLPSSAYGGFRDLMPDFGAAVTAGRAQWPIVQGRAVGGTSVINSAICVRTPGDLFPVWEERFGVRPELARQVEEAQDVIERELCATVTPREVMGRSNLLALKGAESLGYTHHPTTRYVKRCEGTGQCLQGCGRGRKQSLNLNYIPELLERGGEVLSCAPVSRVLLKGKRAVGVEGAFKHPKGGRAGAHFTVRGRRGVVMAASAVHSPWLMLRSGIRMPALGHGFRSHPGTGLFGWYEEPVDMNLGATQGWASVAFREDPGFKLETLSIPPELVAGRLKGGGSVLAKRLEEYRHLAMWVMAVRAESVGSVSRGPFGPVVRYLLDEADMRRMRAGAVMVARTHFAAGARWVIPGVHGLPYKIGPDQLHLLQEAPLSPTRWVGILSHLFGGCTMGADPNTSVCDDHGRVHGMEGLVVVDASQIPTNLGVNPQHTIMALARIHAEALAG